MNQFRFHDPAWLLAFIPIGLVLWLNHRRGRRSAIGYSNVELLSAVPISLTQRVKRLVPWLWALGAILIALAVARPQFGREEVRITTDGLAIMMCIDRSGSMSALDFTWDNRRVDRLEVVKRVFRDFVLGTDDFAGREADLIGLVAFGGYAESKCPPTLDHTTLAKILDTVQIPQPVTDSLGRVINQKMLEEEQATAIGDAIGVAVDRLKDLQIKSKVIVLLSDGESNAGVLTPDEAAEMAANYGIKIYCIGVGSNGMAPFLESDMFGRQVLQQHAVRLDEAALRKIAAQTDGQYFNARDAETLKSVYAEIDMLEKTETEGKLYTDYRDVYPWLMLPGVACVLVELLLMSTRFRELP